jgi:predicted dinucleotide-binding enzyme
VNIGIIGSGTLGRALGARLGGAGHAVMFASGTAAQEAAAAIPGASAGSNAEAGAFGDVVALAVPFASVGAALADAGPLDGRPLWSCVNALKDDLSGLAVGFDTSAAEHVARAAPAARVVAAVPPFAQALSAGDLSYDGDLSPSVFLCSDDDEAKRIVQTLIVDLGAQPVDAGPLVASRLVEPAMMLLISLAYAGVPRDLGLRLLERDGVR